jgi:hypothetical protein
MKGILRQNFRRLLNFCRWHIWCWTEKFTQRSFFLQIVVIGEKYVSGNGQVICFPMLKTVVLLVQARAMQLFAERKSRRYF